MNWAFVDYENVGTLEGLNISDYERVFVFCGPKNTRIKVGALPTEGFCRIELIGVATTGANNLDFHLAFHLGRFHEVAENGVAFHIISNDGGFNGLVNHLKGARPGHPTNYCLISLDNHGGHVLDIYGRLPPCQALMAEREAGARTYIRRRHSSVYVLRAVMSCEPAGSNTHACSIESIGGTCPSRAQGRCGDRVVHHQSRDSVGRLVYTFPSPLGGLRLAGRLRSESFV